MDWQPYPASAPIRDGFAPVMRHTSCVIRRASRNPLPGSPVPDSCHHLRVTSNPTTSKRQTATSLCAFRASFSVFRFVFYVFRFTFCPLRSTSIYQSTDYQDHADPGHDTDHKTDDEAPRPSQRCGSQRRAQGHSDDSHDRQHRTRSCFLLPVHGKPPARALAVTPSRTLPVTASSASPQISHPTSVPLPRPPFPPANPSGILLDDRTRARRV
jgi:hypothetical protein